MLQVRTRNFQRQGVEVPKFSQGEQVKIVKHPTRNEFQGLNGTIAAVREGFAPNTIGMTEQGAVPEAARQWKYDVTTDTPTSLIVTELQEDWLEMVNNSQSK